MTRKHFKIIAQILHDARFEGLDPLTIDRLIEDFADALKQTNPYFKRDTFMRAAGFSQG
jgi:hypothetical protein